MAAQQTAIFAAEYQYPEQTTEKCMLRNLPVSECTVKGADLLVDSRVGVS
jgi:hypothetical protein